MNDRGIEFQRRAVRPVQCFREGWQLVKDDYWLFFGIAFVGMLIGSAVPMGILLGPMWCGIEICVLRRMRGQRVTFNHLFEGFNFFGPSLVATLFVVLPTIALVVLSYFAFIAAMIGLSVAMVPQGGGPPGGDYLAALIGVIGVYVMIMFAVSLVVGAPLIFMYGLIVERGVSGIEAVTLSMRAVLGNFVGVIGLLLLNLLLGLAGFALLCVGAYLMMPITFAAYAVAYRQVFPRDEPREVVPVDAPESYEPAPHGVGPSSTGIQAEAPRDAAPETGITPE